MARDFEDHCWNDIVDEEILEIYTAYHRKLYVGKNPAVLASAVEFVLEGLHLNKRLNKDSVMGQTRYRG